MEDYLSRYPTLRNHFPFQRFNRMQEACLPVLMQTNQNVVISAPTATGKTVLFELALLKQYEQKPRFRAAYLAPIKCLCQQKKEQWKEAFKQLKVCEMTGDTLDEDTQDLVSSNLIVATPEKLDSITRRSFAKTEFDLLLIDEIHMLSVEGRGACLQAVVTRIMTTNREVRIIAASATIPNIQELARWLKVPLDGIKVFGEEYRPVQIKRHVLGYHQHKSPFVLQRILNSKLPEVILKYSDRKPSLVFCQTQSGTVMACQMLLNTLPREYLITSDRQLTTLVTRSKQLSTEELRGMVVGGVACHNASLTHHDRRIIEELFIAGHLKVICTTTTLSMGVNLPARLVVVKATTCYRGAGRGYEEYTRAEIEQMVGRAGRPQFETQGTAVIMTTFSNVQRYQGDIKLQQLQSQLLTQLKEHINTEIALRTVRNLQDIVDHVKRTFLYVRMLSSPLTYGIKTRDNVEVFLVDRCTETVNDLNKYEMIRFSEDSKQIVPLQISLEVSKSYISVETAKKIIDASGNITCLKEFLLIICQATEISKYRSKLDERKHLKVLNEKIPFPLKEAIATSQKKAFVLLQGYLNGFDVDDWQLRKQTRQICYFLKSLCYLTKKIFTTKKIFAGLYYCHLLINSLKIGAWHYNEFEILCQMPQLKKKADLLKSHNITTRESLEQAIASKELSTACRQNWAFCQTAQSTVANYKLPEFNISLNGEFIVVQCNQLPKLNSQFKGLTVLIGDRNNVLQGIREIRYSDTNYGTAMFKMKSSLCPLYLAVSKEGVIGYDLLYQIEKNGRESVIDQIDFSKKGAANPRPKRNASEIKVKQPADKKRNKSLDQESKVNETIKHNHNRTTIKLTSMPAKENSSKHSDSKGSQDFATYAYKPKKNFDHKQRTASNKPLPKIRSRKIKVGENPLESSSIKEFLPQEKPGKPIESYMQKVNQFESKYATNPKKLQYIFEPSGNNRVEESKQAPLQMTEDSNQATIPTFKPNIIVADYKKSAYDYFRNMMNF